MKSKLLTILVAVVGGLLTLALSVIMVIYFVPQDYTPSIFGELQELSGLSKYRTDSAAPEDSNLSGRPVEQEFCGEYKAQGQTFRVYAYVFQSPEDAAEYYAEVSGRYITGSAGYFRATKKPVYCAFADNRAICVVAKNHFGLSMVLNSLSKVLTGSFRDFLSDGPLIDQSGDGSAIE